MGKPKSACYETMKDKLSQYGSIVGISAFVAAAFMMLVCICGLCVCCAPTVGISPTVAALLWMTMAAIVLFEHDLSSFYQQ